MHEKQRRLNIWTSHSKHPTTQKYEIQSPFCFILPFCSIDISSFNLFPSESNKALPLIAIEYRLEYVKNETLFDIFPCNNTIVQHIIKFHSKNSFQIALFFVQLLAVFFCCSVRPLVYAAASASSFSNLLALSFNPSNLKVSEVVKGLHSQGQDYLFSLCPLFGLLIVVVVMEGLGWSWWKLCHHYIGRPFLSILS